MSLELPGFTSDLLLWQLLLLTVISLGVGILGGFAGLALGTMRLPALLLMGVAAPVAAGTNILVSVLASLGGSIRHFQEHRIDFRVAWAMGLPAVVGSLIGGLGSDQVPEALLVGLAALFVLWQGIELFQRARRESRAEQASSATTTRGTSETIAPRFTGRRLASEGGIGLGVGPPGGAVGLILGSIRLPALINILRMNPRVAAGTNLVIGIFMGLFGFIGHGIQGQVDVPALLAMGAAAMVGSAFGARLTGRVSLRALVHAMEAILFIAGALLLVDAVRRGV